MSFSVGPCLFVLLPAFFCLVRSVFSSCYVHGPAMRLAAPFLGAFFAAWGCDAPALQGFGIHPQTIHFSLRSREAAVRKSVFLRRGKRRNGMRVPAQCGYASLYCSGLHLPSRSIGMGVWDGDGVLHPPRYTDDDPRTTPLKQYRRISQLQGRHNRH